MSRFLNHDDPTTLFSLRDRQQVAYEILATTVYGKRKDGEIGIDRLLDENVYSAAFPLHDVCDSSLSSPSNTLCGVSAKLHYTDTGYGHVV